MKFVFQDFASLKETRGVYKTSPKLECHGYLWQLILFPGGGLDSCNDETMISVYLHCVSSGWDRFVTADIAIRHISANTKCSIGTFTYSGSAHTIGHSNYVSRAKILNPSNRYLVNGNLTFTVDLRVACDKYPPYSPKGTLHSDMLKMLEKADADSADLVFEVGMRGKTTIHAHSIILKARAPVLAALTKDTDKCAPIRIVDVEPDNFQILLRYVYGDEIPDEEILMAKASTLIRVADRFGCVGLKLAAEVKLVETGIDTNSAADLILFADANNCALLKEAAVDYFLVHTAEVMETEGYTRVQESCSTLSELLNAHVISKKLSAPSDTIGEKDYKRMCVSQLLDKLDARGLDVDGSKEMLIERLEEAGGQPLNIGGEHSGGRG